MIDTTEVRRRVDDAITRQLDLGRADLADLMPEAHDLLAAIGALMAGGKRLRPLFLHLGYRAAGRPDDAAAVELAASVEFLQAAALIHDDVIDRSATRRGVPTVHTALAAAHRDRGWEGDAERFGEAGAILAGNLCLGWSQARYAGCGLSADDLARARPAFDLMHTQLMAGQYLDVVEAARPWSQLSAAQRIDQATRVITYKSAKYSIQHPLLIGAQAGGVSGAALDALGDYGLALGIAFQLRDDLLGIFGDPAETGKPAGDDLREGKRTVLIAHTLAGCAEPEQAYVERALGDPGLDDAAIEKLRDVIRRSGAVARVEAAIAQHAGDAAAALDRVGVDPEAATVLREMIGRVTERRA